MNQWQFLDIHFAQAMDLPAGEQARYLEGLMVPDHLDPKEVKKELAELLEGHRLGHDHPDFLEPATTVKKIIGRFKASGIKKYDEIADHIILETLGEGSFGKVYLAENKKLGRKVALKVSPDMGNESRTLASMEHENIVKIHEELLMKDQGLRVVSLQYISGPTLKKVFQNLSLNKNEKLERILEKNSIKHRPFTSWENADWEKLKNQDNFNNLLEIIYKLARALEHAHDLGIHHLDIKPGNILLSPAGTPYLADFNISTRKASDTDFIVGGTEKYMPPEQKEALTSNDPEKAYSRLDGRCDVYSMGIILKEALELTGQRDFDLNCVMKRATRKDPLNRFQTIHEFANALECNLQLRQRLARTRWLKSFMESLAGKPLVGLLVAAAIPHVIGSAISIAYNYLRIVTLLSTEQQQTFYKTVLAYNGAVIPIGGFFLMWSLSPVRKTLECFENGEYCFWKGQDHRKARLALTNAPRSLFLIGSIGWLVAIVVFPGIIHLVNGSLPPTAIAHFAISFILSWAISVTYSVLFFQHFNLKNVTPLFMGSVFKSSKLSDQEVEHATKTINFYHTIAAVIPMLMALLILTLDPVNFSSGSFGLFRTLSAVLIIVGMGAFLLESRLKETSRNIIEALGH